MNYSKLKKSVVSLALVGTFLLGAGFMDTAFAMSSSNSVQSPQKGWNWSRRGRNNWDRRRAREARRRYRRQQRNRFLRYRYGLNRRGGYYNRFGRVRPFGYYNRPGRFRRY